MTTEKTPDFRDNVSDDEKARLLDQSIAAKSSERYAIEVQELAGADVDTQRKAALDEALSKLHGERAKLTTSTPN